MKHYCKDHRGDESVYDPINCDLCKAEQRIAELGKKLTWLQEQYNALNIDRTEWEDAAIELEAKIARLKKTELRDGEGRIVSQGALNALITEHRCRGERINELKAERDSLKFALDLACGGKFVPVSEKVLPQRENGE